MAKRKPPKRTGARKAGLNARQRRFVEEYLLDLNATAAAKRAGYSQKTAYSIGQQLLKKLEVATAIKAAIDARSKKASMSAAEVLEELSRVARSNMENYVSFGPNGVRIKESSELSEDALRAIAEVSETVGEKTNSIRFKLHPKNEALIALARHHGLLKDRLDLDAPKVETHIYLPEKKS